MKNTNTEAPFNAEPDEQCPKCGHTEYAELGLNITFDRYSGNYCMKCWAQWISENIPKMVKITKL